jgi:hypothetical protein
MAVPYFLTGLAPLGLVMELVYAMRMVRGAKRVR